MENEKNIKWEIEPERKCKSCTWGGMANEAGICRGAVVNPKPLTDLFIPCEKMSMKYGVTVMIRQTNDGCNLHRYLEEA